MFSSHLESFLQFDLIKNYHFLNNCYLFRYPIKIYFTNFFYQKNSAYLLLFFKQVFIIFKVLSIKDNFSHLLCIFLKKYYHFME